MDGSTILIIALATFGLFVVRHVAARRLGTGRARYAWLIFLPSSLLPLTTLWLALRFASTEPGLAIVLGITGLGYGALLVRMIRGVARAAASAMTPAEVADRTVEPIGEFMVIVTVLLVIGTIVFGIVVFIVTLVSGSQ